jgi:DNA-binding NtrC family response regulator/pSer/pThr/pTyr-binding forkhead associated (FHA) protein
MSTELLTQDAGATSLGQVPDQDRAFLVIHVDLPGATSRVVELQDGVEISFGRSRGATIIVDHEKVSRMHARIRRRGDVLEVEDLGSRNSTRINGERIEGVHRLTSGDEISIGPLLAVVNLTSGLRRRLSVASADAGEARLTAEVDRAIRYHRPVTVALLKIGDDAGVDAVARGLRAMDLLAEDGGDEYLAILPELGRNDGTLAVERLLADAHAAGATAKAGTALCPDDGTTTEELIGRARRSLQGGRSAKPAETEPPPSDAIALDPVMRRVFALVERIADTAITVLILGETGVGKEVITEAIHRRSSRRDRPLIKLNCAALPETLLESELFGHERGAFTGAERRKLGFFEAAGGGTLFLDEIGEIPLSLQAKLLRVLERKVITRVGGTAEVAVDTRLIAATHRDLEAEVRAGRFRQDLLFRIGGFTLAVPPLRDRPAEVLPLAEHFLRTACAEQSRPVPGLSADARDALSGYAWPGNVRELKNAIERALVLCGDTISSADLPDKLRDATRRIRPVAPSADVREHLAEVERAAIVAALEADRGNQTRAAQRLGLSRRALIYKMEKYGLKAPPARGDGS